MFSALFTESLVRKIRSWIAPLPEDINRYLHSQGTIIDLGAGSGYVFSKITVPVQRYAVETWKKKREHLKHTYQNAIVFEDIQDVDSQFDVVTCIDVLHHITSARNVFLKKLLTLPKEGGYLIIKDMRKDLPFHRLVNRLHDFLSTGSFIEELNDKELTDFLVSNAFSIQKHVRYECGPYAHYYVVARREQ